jgi:hypothetical protein
MLFPSAKFATLTPDSSCSAGEDACVNGAFAQCVNGKFSVFPPCSSGLVYVFFSTKLPATPTLTANVTSCAALPLVNSPGTSVTCTTAQDRDARIAATGATAASAGSSSSQAAGSATSSVATSSVVSDAGVSVLAQLVNVDPAQAPAASSTAAANNTGQGSTTGNSTSTDGGDPQSSLTLSPQVIAKGFENDGQDQ